MRCEIVFDIGAITKYTAIFAIVQSGIAVSFASPYFWTIRELKLFKIAILHLPKSHYF